MYVNSVFDAFVEVKSILTCTHRAVHQVGIKCLDLLLKTDHTYFKDHRGRTVFHCAAEVGSVAACELVLTMRADAVHDLDRMVRESGGLVR